MSGPKNGRPVEMADVVFKLLLPVEYGRLWSKVAKIPMKKISEQTRLKMTGENYR